MKVLIAYDGSGCSDSALNDLHRAGLPVQVEARIFTVAEPSAAEALYPVEAVNYAMAWYPLWQPSALLAPAKQLEQTRHVAASAADRLRREFPAWTVEIDTAYGVPGVSIDSEAETWKPDLIVMGSHRRTGFAHLMLGSVSQHVLNHSACATRIARPPIRQSSDPIRLLIGVDGSEDAAAAVCWVARRTWPRTTEARVIGVTRSAGLTAAADISAVDQASIKMLEEARSALAHAVAVAAASLRQCGLTVTHQVLVGSACDVLLGEAANWNADCIFLGARGVGALHRLLLGSVSAEVAAKAQCSVEVVRHGAARS